MPCESCTDDPIHPDLAHLAATLHERQTGALTLAISELAAMLAEASNVRVLPSDRLSFRTSNVPAGRAVQIVGQQIDRARVTIVNSGPTTVALGRDETVTGDTLGRFDLLPGAEITLPTRAEIWAHGVTADGTVSILAEEFDA